MFNNLPFFSAPVCHIKRGVGIVGTGNEVGVSSQKSLGKKRISLFFVESPHFFFHGSPDFPSLVSDVRVHVVDLIKS